MVGDNLEHCYKTLGLTPEASFAEVKHAYRALAKAWHPDRFAQKPHLQQQALEKFHVINRAYASIRQATQQAHRDHAPARPAASPPRQAAPTARAAHRVSARVASLPTWAIALVAFVTLRLLVAHSLTAVDLWPPPLPRTAPPAVPTDAVVVSHSGTSQEDVLTAPPLPMSTFQDAEPTAPATNQPTLSKPAQPCTALRYFTAGSTKAEVLAVQGRPTLAGTHVWEYDGSHVYFRHDRVTGWDIWPRSPLKVRLLPATPLDTTAPYFTVGSTKDEVLAVQGTPSHLTERMWEYGHSRVYFDDNRVTRWDEWRGSPLKARLASTDAG